MGSDLSRNGYPSAVHMQTNDIEDRREWITKSLPLFPSLPPPVEDSEDCQLRTGSRFDITSFNQSLSRLSGGEMAFQLKLLGHKPVYAELKPRMCAGEAFHNSRLSRALVKLGSELKQS